MFGHACKGDQTSMCFECMLPTVEEYLALPEEEIDSSSSGEEMMGVHDGE